MPQCCLQFIFVFFIRFHSFLCQNAKVDKHISLLMAALHSLHKIQNYAELCYGKTKITKKKKKKKKNEEKTNTAPQKNKYFILFLSLFRFGFYFLMLLYEVVFYENQFFVFVFFFSFYFLWNIRISRRLNRFSKPTNILVFSVYFYFCTVLHFWQ